MNELGNRVFETRGTLFDEIARKLKHQAKIEELIFYPEGKSVDKDLTLEACEEHDEIKHLISKIRKAEPSDEAFMTKFTVLKEVFARNVKQEEKSKQIGEFTLTHDTCLLRLLREFRF